MKSPGFISICFILKPQPSRALQHHDPLVLVLVVPEAFRRGVAVRDDSLDADVGVVEQRCDKLVGQVSAQLNEEIQDCPPSRSPWTETGSPSQSRAEPNRRARVCNGLTQF